MNVCSLMIERMRNEDKVAKKLIGENCWASFEKN